MNEGNSLAPLDFLQLAGHPLRWALMTRLTHSDYLVDELAIHVAQPQNLVSYHLGKLRTAGLVTARRSARDGREVFYRLNIARCEDLFGRAANALHPAVNLASKEWPASPSADRLRVLFLCTQNIARSQMAEALLRARSGGSVLAASAGSRPGIIHSNTIRVLEMRGLDIRDQQSKHVDSLAAQSFDLVITVCDHMRAQRPEIAGAPEWMHWSIPDPAQEGEAGKSLPLFQEVANEIEERVLCLLPALTGDRMRATAGASI